MKSSVVKRSIVINCHKTSVSLEDQFWSSLKQIAQDKSVTLSEIVGQIDSGRGEQANLSSAIRLYILAHFRERVAAAAA
ncbi:ribbon-helix-helix domain-containing protein [Xanthobacteraceae bacterium Astr-EGSB]|uniref:ribbon-helix-helix domain-containing protein n=1 Tax=Astrobacterium formosum TaxID=3069710 RepID=UPI0027B74D6A|nr:ribbon-helix-helix domain-containing protein [Xanthobacteraceae bacterium Astr-EGSB]